jgi:dsDNA-specific endonuclease/ATPase MutS2
LLHLGLPTKGETKIPAFQEVYYFAKNKGSMSKGAFETLLTQLSMIKPGKSTIVLADEIESVTEPGTAGTIICATANYFIEKNCFMILATHLGREVQGQLPLGARIDGIEAKGLTESFELIVDHNPVMGKLAHSTPELIIERLAYSKKEPYFTHLHDYLRKRKN